MRDLEYYIDTAKENSPYKSDRMLSMALGGNGNTVNTYRKRGVMPSDETMRKLAILAEIDPEIALIDLSIWRTSGEAQKAYANILHKLTNAATIAIAVIVISLGFSTPSAYAKTPIEVSSPQHDTVSYGM